MNSPAMEKEGLIRCLKALADRGVYASSFVTDQHPSITKMMADEFPEVRHFYDGWHVVKGNHEMFDRGKWLSVCQAIATTI